MKDYLLEHGSPSRVPQSEPLSPDQVPNAAGGYAWSVPALTRLRRFLILGTQGGTYYASERDFTKENLDVVRDLAQNDGLRLVDEIVAVSASGRAAKNDPALYALAVAISLGDRATKRAAAEALPQVARIGTHLYHFVAYAESLRGWGSTLRWAVSNWYASKPVEKLAYDAVKYRQRDGWTHRDLLRLSHPKATSAEQAVVFGWITHRGSFQEGETVGTVDTGTAGILQGYENAQRAETAKETAALVRGYRLPWEALKSDHRTDPEVWRALLDAGMPTTALVRNLGNLTRHDVLDSGYRKIVTDALRDPEQISKSRIHPIALLLAQATYGSGRGFKGTNSWVPIPAVMDALDEAFYLAFGNVEPTGKRILQAIDVSGSMDRGDVAGTPLTPRAAAAALALLTVQVEDDVDTVTFSCSGAAGGYSLGLSKRWGLHRLQDAVEPYALSRRQRLDNVVGETSRMPMGGTDCALPMLYATETGREYDAFVIYTDNETWAGNVHPAQALRDYRRQAGIPTAKLAVVAVTATGYSIADPDDAGMLDVVGFDTASPGLVADFITGRI